MTNKERFLTMVSGQESTTMDRLKWRAENREWLNHSRKIALMVLEALKEKGLNQKQLAERMDVSPQMVNKWVKGKENFTIETISKLESALGIAILNFPKSELVLETVITGVVSSSIYPPKGSYESNVRFEKPLRVSRVHNSKERCDLVCGKIYEAS